MAGHSLKEYGTDSRGRKLYTVETEYSGGNWDPWWRPWWVNILIFLFTTSGILALGLFLCLKEIFHKKKDTNISNIAIIAASILHVVYLIYNYKIGRDYNPVETGNMQTFVVLRLILGLISFYIMSKLIKK